MGKRAREAAAAPAPSAPAAPVAGPSTSSKKRRKTTHAANESGATVDSAVVLAADTSDAPVPVEADEDDEAERARRRKAKGKGRAVDPPQPAAEDPQQLIARLRADLDHKNTLAQAQQELIDKLKSALACPICLNTYSRPMTMACGHAACRACLVQCFKRHDGGGDGDDDDEEAGPRRPMCPSCRDPVLDPPEPLYALREASDVMRLAEKFGGVAADPTATGTSATGGAAEPTSPSKAAADDRLAGDPTWGGLFPHAATKSRDGRGGLHGVRRRGIEDREDRVQRCWNCNWEIEDGQCEHCGEVYDSDAGRGSDDDGDESDGPPPRARRPPRATSSEAEAVAIAMGGRGRANGRGRAIDLDADDSEDDEHDDDHDSEMDGFIVDGTSEQDLGRPPRAPRAPIPLDDSDDEPSSSDAPAPSRPRSGLQSIAARVAGTLGHAFGDPYDSAADATFDSADAVTDDIEDPDLSDSEMSGHGPPPPHSPVDDLDDDSSGSSSDDAVPVVRSRHFQAPAPAAVQVDESDADSDDAPVVDHAAARAAAGAAAERRRAAAAGPRRRVVIDSDSE